MKRLLLPLIVLSAVSAPGAENLLRNGSFEGGLLYWHNLKEEQHSLVPDAKNGQHALQLKGGYIMSAPFVAERDKNFTISLWAKGAKAGKFSVSMPPSAREPGQKARRLWTKEAGQSAEIGTDWTRVSFTFPADVPRAGFWPLPHYLVQVSGGKSNTVTIDGLTVTAGDGGTTDYIPRRSIEVVTQCDNLPGYAGAAGNIFERGATAKMTGHLSNPTPKAQTVTARWQLIDYEGLAPIAAAVDKTVTIAPGETLAANAELPLVRVGCVLARLSAIGADGSVIDKSDFPLTSLPYPKHATKPDTRERFGGSFAGGKGCIEKFQRIGFGWTRWYPQTKWQDLEPEPGKFNWHEKQFAISSSHGVSSHVVLYGWPKWIMEHHGHPLPKDMRWPADDPRWDDLSIDTAWDKFVKATTAHFKGKPVVLEIQNEPELDRWNDKKEQYAQFTMRTARQIKKVDPDAKVMVNNLYGIPSGINAAFLAAGGGEFIDIISWHDYHSGWLADHSKITQFKQNLESYGAGHVEIWFNEGWAFTNTAVDEEIACTGLTSAQSTNVIFDSVAEMSVAGQEKTILFHTAYETHGMSFWDYSGPGTMLWDWYNNPLPLVAAWNVLTHHIGVSDEVGFTRPPGANFCVFQDLRNKRGVAIAYADRKSDADVVVELPDFGTALVAEDAMGNVSDAPEKLVLSKTGRPVLLYAKDASVNGTTLLEKLQPLDRKFASFVSSGGGDSPVWNLPATWEGAEIGSDEGHIAMADGTPVWKLEHVWPPEPGIAASYVPMIWKGTEWKVKEGEFGGQPSAKIKDDSLILATRAPHGKPPKRRTCALTFVVPEDGTYRLQGTAKPRVWDGSNKTKIQLYLRSGDTVTTGASIVVPDEGSADLGSLSATAKAGDLISLVPVVDGMFSGCNLALEDFAITTGEPDATSGTAYRLPASWEGEKIGSATGNPALAGGKPIWRIDRLYPSDPIMASAYSPMPWAGTEWKPKDHTHGGQPSAKVESGGIKLSVAGPWKNFEFQKTGALAFIAPEDGNYKVKASAHAKPWTGGSKTFTLALMKKDTQRAAELKTFELPRDDTPVPIELEIELSEGHELLFVPLMPHWNNATNIWIDDLTITLGKK